jgi:hypothetical protein
MNDKQLFSKLMPESGRILLTSSGQEFIKRLGIESVKKTVLGVLKGENLRTQTEFLTRNRLCQLSAALIDLYLRGVKSVDHFSDNLFQHAINQIGHSKKSEKSEQWPAMWFMGMTEKQFQNILRSNVQNYEEYTSSLQSTIQSAVTSIQKDLGDIRMTLGYSKDINSGNVVELSWREILHLAMAIGSQTLAIRGSEKSMYGKLFERLILGTVFTLLGFKPIDIPQKKHYEKGGYFWLSDKSQERESDGTIVYAPWNLARFDIGFIGRGNSEVTKDKLSRFANQEEHAGRTLNSKTFVIVDKLPNTSKTTASAQRGNTEIVQMSMSFWILDLAKRMKKTLNFTHPIQTMNESQISDHLSAEIDKIDFFSFLSKNTILEEFQNDQD